MSVAAKLEYLNDTKQLLKENINSLGGNLTTEPFRQYASVLEGIYGRIPKVSGIGSVISLSPTMVGKIKLNEIQGDTLQENTPTPDTPVEIQSVTGLQNIKICGKNLFNANNNTYKDTWVTHTIDNTNKITVTNSYSWARLETTIKNLKPNTNYTISTHITNASGLNCGLWGARDLLNISTNTNFKSSITKQSDSSGNLEFYFYVNYSGTTTSTGTVTFDTIQIEKNTQATSYEPYKGNTYEVNLGKNLFDKDNANILNAYFDGSHTSVTSAGTNRTTYIKVQPNTTYTISKLKSIRSFIGTTQTLPAIGTQISNISNIGSGDYDGTTRISGTITTGVNDNYIVINYANTNTDTGDRPTTILQSIQIELGSSATSYSPYFTPIELNKIGTYKDSIKKSTGKNLFNIKTIVKGRLDNGVVGYESDTSELTLNDNSYSFTTTKNYRGIVSDFIEVKGNTTYILSSKNDISVNFNFFDTNKTFISTANGNDGTSVGRVVTTPANAKYVRLYNWLNSAGSTTVEIPQFEENSQMTSYEPYGKVWYLEKQTRKLELAIANMNNNENFPGWNNQTQLKNDWPNINTQYLYNTGFKYLSSISVQPSSGYDTLGMNTASGSGAIYLNKNYFNLTQTQWKEQYPNLIFSAVYYLQTPEITEITNEELIEDLETLYTAKSQEGTTNISITSEDLEMILNVSALKGDVE